MNILLFSDIHWSTTSSIIRQRGRKYSLRLEHLIATMNWINKLAIDTDCTAMICCGDMMDKPQLTDEELTALQEIQWNSLPCYFLCGNHESSVSDLRFSSLKALEAKNHFIISEPTVWKYDNNENEIRFLPYMVESDRKPLNEYFGKGLGKTIIVSHNDIAGINYGGFESKIGFSISEIEANSTCYFNGHLHNSGWVSKHILNVGSTSAHNFTNDSNSYKYGIWILNTDDLSLKFIENPYAFNFYKLEINKKEDLKVFDTLKDNAVLSIKCNSNYVDETKELILTHKNIIESRIIIVKDMTMDSTEIDMSSFNVDHIAKFIECARAHYGTDAILEAELAEVCK